MPQKPNIDHRRKINVTHTHSQTASAWYYVVICLHVAMALGRCSHTAALRLNRWGHLMNLPLLALAAVPAFLGESLPALSKQVATPF